MKTAKRKRFLWIPAMMAVVCLGPATAGSKTLPVSIPAPLVNSFGTVDSAPKFSGDQRTVKELIAASFDDGQVILSKQQAQNTGDTRGVILYRGVYDCATKELTGDSYSKLTVDIGGNKGFSAIGRLQIMKLDELEGGVYLNYTCGSRYQQQCIDDGTFDRYYDEFCSKDSGIPEANSKPEPAAGRPAVLDPASAASKFLYRIVRDCSTRKPVGRNYEAETMLGNGVSVFGKVQKINLAVYKDGTYGNYTCGDRYRQQCVNDGGADSYYDEWCENN